MESLTAALADLNFEKVNGGLDKNDKRCVASFEQLENELEIDDFSFKDDFIKVGDVFLDKDEKRKTAIQFTPVIDKELWREHCEWVYIFTCNQKIIKIGGTRTGLLKRTQSYLCGTPENRKRGTCSTTNYTLYKSFQTLIECGHKIEMYGRKLKEHKVEVSDFGMKLCIAVQTFHVFETKMLEEYKKQKGAYPILSSNADKRFAD